MTISPIGASTGGHDVLMDRVYRHQRHIYDITRKYYLLGRDRMIDGLALAPGESLLEIGCGTGRNLAQVHKRYPGAKLYGLDISSEMLTTARRKLAGVLERPEDLRELDATLFTPSDFGREGFDRVMISYALSMIPDWQQTLDRALAALNPGGMLHIVDFGGQRRLPRLFRTLLRAWLARFHVTPRDSLKDVLESKIAGTPFELVCHSHGRDYAWLLIVRHRSS